MEERIGSKYYLGFQVNAFGFFFLFFFPTKLASALAEVPDTKLVEKKISVRWESLTETNTQRKIVT